MKKNFNDFWTEKDDSIKIDFSFDPLGVMVIWRLFAQEIFGNKITTVANNMRYYLINLFNLTTVRMLLENDKIKEKYLNKNYDEGKLRDDLIIFLENLFIYCSSKKNGLDLNTVPGVAKYNSLKKKNKYIICFEGKANNYEILTRQLQLGINGRYKTPFKEMGFDYGDIYNSSKNGKNWQDALSLIKDEYDEYDKWINCVINLIKASGEIEYDSIPSKICEFITKQFLEPSTISDRLSDFLLKKIGLTDNTAKILYNIVKEYKNVTVKDIFEGAKIKTNDKKIEDIFELESFLAPIQHVFDGIIETSDENLSDYKILEKKLPKFDECNINENVLNKSETAKKRFNKLKEIVRGENKIKELIKYHNEVQEDRGSASWVFLDENDKINRVKLFGTRSKLREWLEKSKKENRFEKWKNDYYISSLKSIIDSMGTK